MRKYLLYSLTPVAIILLVLVSAKSVSAFHQQQVLGVAQAATVSIPPTSEGPGLILPDSPFYFLDKFKQNVRLLFAFTPEEKAKVNANIAGERLAELRIMLVNKNIEGSRIALIELAESARRSADELSKAKLTGRDISLLSKTINDDFKSKQSVLDALENETRGEIKQQVKLTSSSITEAKVKVEDILPTQFLETEIRDALQRNVSKRVKEASNSSRELERDLDELRREASSAAKSSLTRREKFLKKAIEEKNEVLKKVQEKLLEQEKERQEKLLQAQDKASEKAREAINKAIEAAKGFQQAQEAFSQIKNQTSGSTTVRSNKSSDSGKSDSGKSGGGDRGGKSGKD